MCLTKNKIVIDCFKLELTVSNIHENFEFWNQKSKYIAFPLY